MDVFVLNKKTKESWLLDYDVTKPVYLNDDNELVIDLNNISKFQFYPVNPNSLDQEKEGYQFSIFDFINT